MRSVPGLRCEWCGTGDLTETQVTVDGVPTATSVIQCRNAKCDWSLTVEMAN